MSAATLRPVRSSDIETLANTTARWGDEFEFFGFAATNQLQRWYADSGCLGEQRGMLIVEVNDELVGSVHWHTSEYGPQSASQARRIGIALLPEYRGRGHGSAAQALLARYLFATSNVNRIEAGTDSGNLAEQRALEKAGFLREGVIREAQYRDARWHDIVLYGKLRSDE